MKTKLSAMVLVVLLFSTPIQAYGGAAVFTTGQDWTDRMSAGEKVLSIVAPMSVLFRYGVPFRLRPEDYIPAMDQVLKNNPHLAAEDVANIFASTVYVFEPETRPVLDNLETRFLQGDYRTLEPGLRILRDLE